MTVSSPEPPFFPFTPVRTRIYRQLSVNDRPPVKLVAITAPTGYGKTVLMSALYRHYRQAGASCYWMALDDRDSGIERVLQQLEDALQSLRPEVDPRAALHQGDEPVEERITNLLASLAQVRDPTVLFIDNLGYCTDPRLRRLLDALLFRTPAALWLVLSSTDALPFDQSRAKLEARLQTVGIAELGFQTEEVRELLTAELCARLDGNALDAIQAQTEGWAAALRLLQIVLSSSPQPQSALAQFSGADEDLALLNRQLLQNFDPDFRTFLLEIALLRTFGVNLCREAIGDPRAADFIRQLLQRNLFVLPLDRNRSWYRLHGLFREFLLDEGDRQIEPARRREILARAAEWCEHGGYWQDAIDYALSAESTSLAAAILERVAAMFVRDRGDLHQYIQWVERLHAAGNRGGWETDFWYVWALVFQRRYEYARVQLKLLGTRVQRDGDAELSPAAALAVRRRLQVIGLAIDVYTDHLADAHRNAMAWLPGAVDDHPFDVATVACAATIYNAGSFDFVEAHQTARLAQSSIAQTDSDYGLGWVVLIDAMIRLHKGEFVSAHEELQSALQRARKSMGDGTGIGGTIALLAAKSAVEMGREDALELLGFGLRRAQHHGIVDSAAFGLDAALKLWTGQDDGVLSIAYLREIAAAYPPRLSLMFSCFLVRRLLRLGRVEEAQVEAAQIRLGSACAHLPDEAGAAIAELRAAVAIELHIAAGRLKPAALLIAEEQQHARERGRGARQVELALDEVAIALRSHNPAPAARHLARAVSLAAKRHYLRPFRDRAELVAGVANETRPKDWNFPEEIERRFFADVCRGLPIGSGALLNQLDQMDAAPALSETPTARELELLRLVEAGLSNQQLADRLSLSLATVKWHLYNLYSKLGVSSRSAALARARALNLLAL